MGSPLISAIICTYNRAERLELALEALCTQSLPATAFEILVVDNASTDRTRSLCEAFQRERLPQLRYLFEPVQGLSRARNTGWQAAGSPYVAFLDDDAIPSPGWLAALLASFQTVLPEPVSVGGPIAPLWEVPRPDWVIPMMEVIFTTLDGGEEPRWFAPNEFPWGANVAYRREALVAAGGFCERLGRVGVKLLSGEEYLLNATLQRLGGGFYYDPQASVQHWIPKERVNAQWLIGRSYWQGRSVALIESLLGRPALRLYLGSTWSLLRVLFDVQKLIAQFWPDPKVRIRERMVFSWRWGYFSQVWSDTLNRSSP
ncbi:glycosyltransferase family 2 protein [Gloeobacter kilaueensis]|uniref:Glycosyl transferase family 2 n=1 Tax=Gloeobacter kilaueensis (strain ATCC BAA-2537 / CCAP 1431/1 / ULC 316 / JS1) TaxID=1183438 RepID=U5QLZ7_GLOK1|nr:glycosyltransferase [Gloeobacter kilaueensis]AGY58639.1 glycosyl transferase family 2 [Gloeobacter kilaueensis JS1]